jgi:Zn-dependent protease with chaperone function
MSDLYNAVLLALAWFAAVNAALSAVAWTIARRLPPGGATAAGWLLTLRLAPAAASLLFVGGIFAPAHWRFEPRGGDESFGAGVHLLAMAGALILAQSAWRALASARASWRLRACNRQPPLQVAGGFQVFEVHGLAGVSLAGLFRPRILVGPAVRDALTPEELDVAVAHEVAHGASRDNWKRLALFCAPDLFGATAAARRLEGAWRAAAECAADARAAAGDKGRAADLASALVKVARLGADAAPQIPAPVPAWSSLHDAPLLEARVQRLVSAGLPTGSGPRRPWAAATSGVLVLVGLCVGFLAARELHLLTELLAHSLP